MKKPLTFIVGKLAVMNSKLNNPIRTGLFFLSVLLLVRLSSPAQVTFRSNTSITIPENPYEMAKGDFNNDGKPDLITANFTGLANRQITLLLNTGTGTFAGANVKNFAASTQLVDVAVGDFNEDGNLDVVACSDPNDNFSILLGNGAGNLGAATNIATGDRPYGIAVGDMNKDSNLDVLVSHIGTPDDVLVFLGNGLGGFSAPITVPIPTNTGWDITVSDFNNDTNPDFAISTAGVYTFQIWTGNGQATPAFTLAQTVTGLNITPDIDAYDLDGDGDMDLLGPSGYTLNDGTGTFAPTVTNLLQSNEEYTVGDLNNDGKPDIASYDGNSNGANVRVYIGNGLGAFTLLGKFQTAAFARGLQILDVNNDGNADVVGAGSLAPQGRADILLGDGTGYFSNTIIKFPTATDPRDLVKGDFNEDGQIDIALCHHLGSIVTIYLGQGNGKFTKTTANYTTGGFPSQIITIDYNKDNHVDLVTYNQISSNVTVLTGAGNGSFSLFANLPVTTTTTGRMATADFNNDTNPDLVVSGYTSRVINYLSGTGSGFNSAVTIATSADIQEIKAADFNSDGKVDLVADLSNLNTFTLFLGNGTGGFTESTTQYPHAGSFFMVEDINNDSQPDVIAFTNSAANDLFINDGAGNFSGSAMPSSLGGFPWGYADMNGDGFKDLIVGSQNPISSQPGQVLVFRGTATGISNTILIDHDLSGGNRLVVHDVNADGKPDVITTSFYIYEDYLGVLINTTGPPPCTPPTITFITPSPTVCVGQSFALSVNASGSSPFTYQWKKGTTDIAGATFSSLPLDPVALTDAGNYTCTVTNSCGNVTSTAIVVTVNGSPPTPPTVTGAGSCTPASVTLTASGGTDGNYRWYTDGFDPDGFPEIVLIGGAVNSSYTTPVLSVTTDYYVSIVSGQCESAWTTVTATIGGTACTTISINIQPSPSTVCIGATTTFTTSATGTTNITYQWQFSTTLAGTYTDIVNGGGYSNVSTATPSINTTGNFGAGFYRCKINGDLVSTVFTNAAQLTVNALPPAPTATGGSNCGTGSVALSASGGSVGQYQWYTVATGGTAISGEVNATFTTPSLTTTTNFFVSINNGICESARTLVTATINTPPSKPVITSSITPNGNALTICSTTTLTLSAPTATSYLWSNGATTQQIAVTASGSYSVVISNAGCASPASDAITVTVVTAPCNNQAPVISNTALSTVIGGQLTLDLTSLVSDADNNIVLSSLSITQQPTSGAPATINNGILEINYSGLGFVGKDRLTIRVCDVLNACTTQLLEIDVDGDIVVYNAISPGSDAMNPILDLKNIAFLDATKNNRVTIFNRWGDVVWEADNYDNVTRVFEGLNKNGSELPSGIYYYKITFVGGAKSRDGFISLKH
jgi:gliding motility-associated-like protein